MINLLRLTRLFSFSLVVGTFAQVTSGAKMEPDWRQWSPSELEKQMSPSRWNPTKTPDEVIGEYVNSSIEGTAAARKLVPNKLDISYGFKSAEKFDIYGTDLPEDAPIFFYIHGGYWQEGSKDISGIFAPLNYKNGIKTVALGYTLAPEAKIADMQDELISSLKTVIEMNPRGKLILVGHSAGGQLAAHILHTPFLPHEIANQLAGLILISGVFDLRPLVSTYVNGPLKMDQKEAESLSVLLKKFNKIVHFENLKVLVQFGGHDSPEFQKQSYDYYDKLNGRISRAGPGIGFVDIYKSDLDDHFTVVQNLAKESCNSYKSVHDFLKSFTPERSETETETGSGSSSASVLPFTLLCFHLVSAILTLL